MSQFSKEQFRDEFLKRTSLPADKFEELWARMRALAIPPLLVLAWAQSEYPKKETPR